MADKDIEKFVDGDPLPSGGKGSPGVRTQHIWRYDSLVPVEECNVNDVCPETELGHQVAAYFNLNIADAPSMMITAKEGEALAAFVIGET